MLLTHQPWKQLISRVVKMEREIWGETDGQGGEGESFLYEPSKAAEEKGGGDSWGREEPTPCCKTHKHKAHDTFSVWLDLILGRSLSPGSLMLIWLTIRGNPGIKKKRNKNKGAIKAKIQKCGGLSASKDVPPFCWNLIKWNMWIIKIMMKRWTMVMSPIWGF